MASSSNSDSLRHRGKAAAPPEPQHWDYGGNPLAMMRFAQDGSVRLPAFGGAAQPGLYKPPPFAFGNPAPLGFAGFALTTFILSLINLGSNDITSPSIVISPAFAYGGLVQLLAGMWEIALGNTFGGFAFSSYGGFWIGTAIILTPGGFRIQASYSTVGDFYAIFGLYLMGWFIITFMLWICTLKSTVGFSSLFLFLWLAFLLLGLSYIEAQSTGTPNAGLLRAGGVFGILSAFVSWYNMFAGLADATNSFFVIPLIHFPWSEKARERRAANNVEQNGDAV